jgi:hypothetical protein
MSTATAPALKSIEAFKGSVSLFRFDFGNNPGPYPFVVVCPDGSLLWGQRLPESTDRRGEPIMLPEIVADKVVVRHTGGTVDELVCNGAPASRATL